jgi:peroxiredoxin
MRQHDIGNPAFSPVGTMPRPGQRFPDLTLLDLRGGIVHISDFRARKKLVIAFAPSLPPFAELRHARSLFGAFDAALLVISPEAAQPEVLADPELTAFCALGLFTDHAPQPAVFVTDQFAEVAAVWPTAAHPQLPSPQEITDWLEYLDSVCPECEPPEWPVEEL